MRAVLVIAVALVAGVTRAEDRVVLEQPSRGRTFGGPGETACADGLDGDGDGTTDCADLDCAESPACSAFDTDGDGVANAADCAPADDGAHAVPDEVPLLRVMDPAGDDAV